MENPTYQEIKDVLSVSNLRIGIENKQYCRERSKVNVVQFLFCFKVYFSCFFGFFKELHHRGRVRVQLKNDDGTPFNPDFTSRDSILIHLGRKIPLLKVRQTGHVNDSA